MADLVYPDARDDAIALEITGDLSGARQLYIIWLEDNPGNIRFKDVLIHASSLSGKALDAINLMESFLPGLPPGDLFEIMARMASLESSLGLLNKAADHFKQASAIGGSDGAQWYFNALVLRFSMGEYSEVRIEALRLSEDSDKANNFQLMDDSAALAALCLVFEAEALKALDEITRYINRHMPVSSVLVWLALYDIALAADHPESANRAVEALHEKFPSSVVAYMVDARVAEWISPSMYIFGLHNSSGVPVQVGAFRSRESAASLRYRLENDGFIAWIEQNNDIWKVLVNDPSGNSLHRLKALGYE